MSEDDKHKELNKYLSNETNLLVATSVIEVGIDIKQANIIVIENANLFGLSQIHQLRGRVGRSDNKSWCVLLHDNNLTEIAKDRLKIIKENNDGFQIAKEDMALRGYGDILGTRQSGYSNYHVLNEELIIELTKKASTISPKILDEILTNRDSREKYKYLFDLYEAHDYKYILT
jgi:ATP-dependent DNA helicase RecG